MPEKMGSKIAALDESLRDYKEALREWIDVIRTEMELASFNSTVPEVDRWERACCAGEEARTKAIRLRSEYESVLRRKFYHF